MQQVVIQTISFNVNTRQFAIATVWSQVQVFLNY
jgi:hypothetical protein